MRSHTTRNQVLITTSFHKFQIVLKVCSFNMGILKCSCQSFVSVAKPFFNNFKKTFLPVFYNIHTFWWLLSLGSAFHCLSKFSPSLLKASSGTEGMRNPRMFVSTFKNSFPIHILSKTRSQFFQKLVPIAQLLQLFILFLYGSPFYLKLFFFFRIFCGFSKNRFFFLVFFGGF